MTRTSDPCDETAIPTNGAAPIVRAAAILSGAADSIGNGAGIYNSFHVQIKCMNLFDWILDYE